MLRYAAVVVLASCGGAAVTSPSAATATIGGRVTAGPTCPVEQITRPCPPRPLGVAVEARAGTRVVASTHSAADGSYRLAVPGGTYTIVAAPATMLPRCEPREIHVDRDATAAVDLTCDTGIR